MSDNYPTLHEMGIKDPEDITRYSLQNINDVDILRVVYKRKKKSYYPTVKNTDFPEQKEWLWQMVELIPQIYLVKFHHF